MEFGQISFEIRKIYTHFLFPYIQAMWESWQRSKVSWSPQCVSYFHCKPLSCFTQAFVNDSEHSKSTGFVGAWFLIPHVSKSSSNRIRPAGFTAENSGEGEIQGVISGAGMSPEWEGSLRQGCTWSPAEGSRIKTNNPGVLLKSEANGARWWLLDVLRSEKKLNSVRWSFLMYVSDATRRLVGWWANEEGWLQVTAADCEWEDPG